MSEDKKTDPETAPTSTRVDASQPAPDVDPLGREIIGGLLEYATRNPVDPLERFIRDLPDEPPFYWRRHARETQRLHQELLSSMQRMLTTTDIREAVGHASYVSRHAVDTTARWAQLRHLAGKWWMLQPPDPIVVGGRVVRFDPPEEP